MIKIHTTVGLSCGVEPSHLIPIEDNFWEIGAGPSGPDTEIFFDRGEEFDPDNIGIRLLEEDIENDRYIGKFGTSFLSQFKCRSSCSTFRIQRAS